MLGLHALKMVRLFAHPVYTRTDVMSGYFGVTNF